MESQQPHLFGSPPACANCGGPFTPVVEGQTLCDRCQGLQHPEPQNPLQQHEVAGYKLLRELGTGRFSQTWLAEDAQARPMVLKLLRRYASDPNSVQRFLAEAQRVAGLRELEHPHVARPVNAGVHLVSAFFLVYENGGELTLADELRERGRLLPSRALELCAQVCEGLAVLHRAGLLHLDLKPANVGIARLDDGTEQAVVLDSCTSHLLSHIGVRDDSPLPLSSAAYAAVDAQPDERSDLYSVGVLLFQLVSGRLPYAAGPTSAELLAAHRDHKPLRLRDVGRRVHAQVEDLLARMLSKDPAQRPESADEAAVVMRAIAPVADQTPEPSDGNEAFEDPLPVFALPADPPEMLPQTDPALERAMLGELPEQPAPAKGLKLPRWWPVAASVAGVASVVALFMVQPRPPPPRPPAPAVLEAATTPVVEPPPAAPAPPRAPDRKSVV